ncbi:MAG: hypothetical protein OXR82_10230 [Gammaproteobacteria bacterium]|nr:hypothetical protein [Gammaproteobacteria bacterium]MDE0258744.1 hypothetical protein [Gammaproteobacteria bacterium]
MARRRTGAPKQSVQQVVYFVSHEPRGLIAVKLHQPRRGLSKRAVPFHALAQAQPRKQPADQASRFLDFPPLALRLQDGIHQLHLLPDGAGHLTAAESREPPARGPEPPGQEAPPLAPVGAQGLTLRQHVLVPGLGDQDGVVPRADFGEGACGPGHLLDARGFGDPARAAVIGAPERRSFQGPARGADHPLHVRGPQPPERPVAAEPPDQLLRLPLQPAPRARRGL